MHWHHVHNIVEFDEIAQATTVLRLMSCLFVLDYFEILTTKQFCSATFSNFQYIKTIPRFVASRQSEIM